MGDRYISLGLESTYGTPVAPFHPTEVTNESLQKNIELAPVKTIRSNSIRKMVNVGEDCAGDLEILGNYNELGPWLYLFYGSVTTTGSVDPWTHTFPATAGTTGRSGISGCVDVVRDGRAFRYSGLKATGIRIDQANNEPAKFNVTVTGKQEVPAGELTGTMTSSTASSTVLTDSSAAFVVDGLIGLIVNNTTDGSTGTITDNDATTITVASLSGGTGDNWENADAYTISAPALSTLTFAALDEMQPSHCTLSFDGGSTTVCPISLTIDAQWAVDAVRCLGSTTLSREPAENDTLIVTGEAQMVFESGEHTDEYPDFDGSTEIDVQVKWDSGAATERSLTLNFNKAKFSSFSVPMSGKDRILASVAWQSYFDATATESMQAVLVGADQTITS